MRWSPDGETAGIQVSFALDEKARSLVNRRSELRNLSRAGDASPEQLAELSQVEAEYPLQCASGRSAARIDQ